MAAPAGSQRAWAPRGVLKRTRTVAPVPWARRTRARIAPARGAQRMLGAQEVKFFDLSIDDALMASGGTVEQPSVNIIRQGTGDSQRVGRKCLIKAIGWRFQVSLPAQTDVALGADTARVILFQDKQCNKAAAVVLDVLESADFQSFNNLSNTGRFRTLMDRTYSLNATAGAGQNASDSSSLFVIDDTVFLKLATVIEFNADAGVIADINSNNIGVLLISRNGRASFSSQMRVRFTDS